MEDDTRKLRRGKMKTKVLTMTLLAMLPATLAYAEADFFTAKIPFAFTAQGKELPAGSYRFKVDFAKGVAQVESMTGKYEVVPFVTILARPEHSTATDSHVVFDKVGDKYSLSEIWGVQQEGVLLLATKGKHEHEVVHAPH
jgi:hypothetical protein